jgi:hypothetical protein
MCTQQSPHQMKGVFFYQSYGSSLGSFVYYVGMHVLCTFGLAPRALVYICAMNLYPLLQGLSSMPTPYTNVDTTC